MRNHLGEASWDGPPWALSEGSDLEATTADGLEPERKLSYTEATDYYYSFKGSEASPETISCSETFL